VVSFRVGPRTGVIIVKNCRNPGSTGCIDYERQRQHILQVRAVDQQGEGLDATVTINVTVIDANDNPPQIPWEEYGRRISENQTTFDNPLVVEVRSVHTLLHIHSTFALSARKH